LHRFKVMLFYALAHLARSRLWLPTSQSIREFVISEALRYGPVTVLPATHTGTIPKLSLLPSHKTSPPVGWYSLHQPMKGWPGWVDLGGWLHIKIKCPTQGIKPGHGHPSIPSTNRARRRLTSLIKTNALPLCQTRPS